MQARVDFVEQHHLTESERIECGADKPKPGSGTFRFFLQLEGNGIRPSAVDELHTPTRSSLVTTFVFNNLDVVDAEVREPKKFER